MSDIVQRRLAAILSIDVVGYTRLMRADEEGTLRRLHALSTAIIDPKIAEYHGRIVKLLGDGWLVEFASVVDAVRCAADIQRASAARNAGSAEEERLVLRIGINLGDVIVEGDDLYGDGVNVATRMQEIAPAGGVSVSGIVYDSVRDKLAPAFEDLGPQQVKNIAEPVRAYRVVLDREAEAPLKPATAFEAAPEPKAGRSGTPEPARIAAVMSSTQRHGAWQVPHEVKVVSVMGSVDLDLREAELADGVTEINTLCVMGEISIEVPDDVAVICEGVGIMGQFDSTVIEANRSSHAGKALRITGFAVMGQTSVR